MFKSPRLRPRQIRHLRHWGMELLVVVVGVLLALLLAEWAEGRAATKRMVAAEEAMSTELNEAAFYLAFRQSTEGCVRDQQMRLLSRLRASGEEWEAFRRHTFSVEPIDDSESISGVLHVPRANLKDAAWQSALATGALEAMERERFTHYVDLYESLAAMQRQFERELVAADALSPLTSNLTLTPEARQAYLSALYSWSRASTSISNEDEFLVLIDQIGVADRKYFETMSVQWDDVLERDFPNHHTCVRALVNPFAPK